MAEGDGEPDKGSEAHYLEVIKAKMDRVDALTPEMRALVHDYGKAIVDAFASAGVTKGKIIRNIITTIWRGQSELGPSEFGEQQKRRELFEAVATIKGHGFAVVPLEPTPAMIAASIDALTVSGLQSTPITRHRKHKVRLQRAIKVATDEAIASEGQKKFLYNDGDK